MQISRLMQKDLVTCPVSCTVHDAAVKMKDKNVGSVLIIEDGGKLQGIVTDRDIALNVAAYSKDPDKTLVSDFMTTNPVSISSDADLESALKTMSKEKIRRLPVTQDGKLVGLLSSSDVAVELKEELDQFMDLEESISKHA